MIVILWVLSGNWDNIYKVWFKNPYINIFRWSEQIDLLGWSILKKQTKRIAFRNVRLEQLNQSCKHWWNLTKKAWVINNLIQYSLKQKLLLTRGQRLPKWSMIQKVCFHYHNEICLKQSQRLLGQHQELFQQKMIQSKVMEENATNN